MTKATKRTRANRRASNGQPNRPGRSVGRAASIDPYAAQLLDPCNADMSGGHYPGIKGNVQRFTKTYITSVTTDTAVQFGFFPGANMVIGSTAANAGTFFGGGFTTVGAPGDAYLTTTAGKYRPVAACVRCWSNNPALSVAGTAAFGVLPATSVQSGFGTSAEGFGSILPVQTKLTADVIEVKWIPGGRDADYHVEGVPTAMPADSDDRNAILFVLSGVPNNSSYTFRVTWICEWVPRPSLEIVANSANSGSSGARSFEIVKALHKHNPMWNISVKPFADAFASAAAPMIASGARALGRTAAQAGSAFLMNSARALPLLTL